MCLVCATCGSSSQSILHVDVDFICVLPGMVIELGLVSFGVVVH